MCMLEDALEQLQISPLSCELIRSKDGIAVYRIETQKEKMVLKVLKSRKIGGRSRTIGFLEISALELCR